jgi:hypothetical protein
VAQRYLKATKLVQYLLALPRKDIAVVARLSSYGAGMNLGQILKNSFLFGQASKVEARAVGLFIRHYAQNSHTLSISGKMLLVAY